MFVKVKFHGILKKLCPKIYEVDAETPSQAIRGITNQLPQLKKKNGERFICVVKECPMKEQLFSTLGTNELNIYPSFIAAGGGNSGSWVTIAVGAVIIATAVVATGGLGAFASLSALGGTFSSMGTLATGATLFGGSLMLSGLNSLLTPVPSSSNTSESKVDESKILTHNQNTTAIGTRIAVAYGKYKIYGQLLSFNMQAVDRSGYGVTEKERLRKEAEEAAANNETLKRSLKRHCNP